MSIQLMQNVWNSDLPREDKFIALAYADFANDEGDGVYPSEEYIAWKCGSGLATVQRAKARLLEQGILKPGYSPGVTSGYKMIASKLPTRPTWAETRESRKISTPQNDVSQNIPTPQNDVTQPLKMRGSTPQNDVRSVSYPLVDPPEARQAVSEPSSPPKTGATAAYRERIAEATARGIVRGSRFDLAKWPEEVHAIVTEVCTLWHLNLPPEKFRGKWIEDARALRRACGELGLEPIRTERRRFEDHMDKHQGVAPYTVGDLGSLYKSVNARAGEMRDAATKTVLQVNSDGSIYV